MAEAGFKRDQELIVTDGPADDFTLPQRREFFIPMVSIEKIREIVDPRMQGPGRGKPVIAARQVGVNARPFPVLRAFNQPGAHRIEADIGESSL